MIILFLSIIIGVLYGYQVISFRRGWKKIPVFSKKEKEEDYIKVSVVIAFRNEADHLAHLVTDLINQSYPSDFIEIILVDDHSKDDSQEILLSATHNFNNFIIYPLNKNVEGKKHAISHGIHKASGKFIITTDADCRLQKNWVSTMVSCYREQDPLVIVGPVVIPPGKAFFNKLESLEFLTLIGSTAGAIGIGNPIMCNAANLGFRKAVYLELEEDILNKASSGDDIFLLLAAKKMYGGHISFLKSREATVFTMPTKDLREFYRQRTRWTSKSRYYKDFHIIFTAIVVFLINFLLLLTVFLVIFNHQVLYGLIYLLTIKFMVDYMLIVPVAKFWNLGKLTSYFIPAFILYPVYVVSVSIFAFIKPFTWKERKIKA